MAPIVSIVGLSNSGKTTLLERLVSELKRRSYRVATIKHEGRGFDLDTPGKDSWRLVQAGSDMMILSSPEKLASIRKIDHDSTLQELVHLVGDSADIILTEGFKKGEAPKIEVHRTGNELLFSPKELIAVVTEEPLDLPVWQCFPGEVTKLADLIESTFLATPGKDEATLFINGTYISLTPFVQEFLTKTLVGMVSALKGVGEIKSLDVFLKINLPQDKGH